MRFIVFMILDVVYFCITDLICTLIKKKVAFCMISLFVNFSLFNIFSSLYELPLWLDVLIFISCLCAVVCSVITLCRNFH